MEFKLSVIIPALNEEKGIEQTLRRLPRDVFEVIVVDGGSTDRTREVASSMGAKVITQPVRGYGLAYKIGAIAANGDFFVTGDADDTYPLEMAPRIVAEMDRRGLDVVSCSRYPLQQGSSMQPLNNIGNRLITLFGCLIAAHRFRDLLSGMWILRRKAFAELHLVSNGWNFSPEVKMEAAWRLGSRFAEVSIPYNERVGLTHLRRPFRTGAENCLFIAYKRGSQLYRRYFMNGAATPLPIAENASEHDAGVIRLSRSRK